jgi:hypothetical protein
MFTARYTPHLRDSAALEVLQKDHSQTLTFGVMVEDIPVRDT